jgi:glycosyltransferase involved in cell wall biosynthesis
MDKFNDINSLAPILVSIIIPTYNRVNLLEETLKSILNQSYSNTEIIVVSDGSTDNTHECIEKLADRRIKFIDIGYNSKLPAKVRNTGLKAVQGSYIAFCDDDDLWKSDKIEKQVYALQHSKANLCFTNFSFLEGDKIINNDFKILQRRILSPLVSSGFKSIMLFTNIIVTSSVMIKRDALVKGFSFDENPFLRASEDYDFWIRILAKNKTLYLKDNLVTYRIHRNQITTTTISNLKRALFVIAQIKNGYFKLIVNIAKTIMKLRIYFGEK